MSIEQKKSKKNITKNSKWAEMYKDIRKQLRLESLWSIFAKNDCDKVLCTVLCNDMEV